MSRSHVPADARLLAQRFAERLELTSTLAALAASGVLAACGGSVTVVESNNEGGGGGGNVTTPVPIGGNGGFGVGGNSPGGAPVGGNSPLPPPVCTPTLGANQYAELMCFDSIGLCPPASDPNVFDLASQQLNYDECFDFCCDGAYVVDVPCADTSVESGCCYVAVVETYSVCEGRPLIIDGEGRTAGLEKRSDWMARPSSNELLDLDDVTRKALADAWAHDARYEHASVASFAQFAMDLMAVGAPADLVRDASSAMADEVDHAERCFALASRFAEREIGPAPLDTSSANPITPTQRRVALFRATLCEGAIGETIATLVAAEARDQSQDAEVYQTLDRIATDEARHAELAWRTLSWLLRSASASERATMIATAHEVLAQTPSFALPAIDPNADKDALRAAGRLDERATQSLVSAALRDIVTPCLRGLLAAPPADNHPTAHA